MIISGFQGIGKSSLCKTDYRYIDLESSNFSKKHNEWYKSYCRVATDLAKQGYIVFVSCHKLVRDELTEIDINNFVVVYPQLKLKDEWIKKLEDRYKTSGLIKDYEAYIYARDNYDTAIKDLNKSPKKVMITDLNYDLKTLLKKYLV